MIKEFRHKGLREIFATGRTAKISASLHRRIEVRLWALDAATAPGDLNVPGFDFHGLHGFEPTRYSIHVNGPWCITFAFDGADAVRVDLEQYH
jgi:proteic killer suppression protein